LSRKCKVDPPLSGIIPDVKSISSLNFKKLFTVELVEFLVTLTATAKSGRRQAPGQFYDAPRKWRMAWTEEWSEDKGEKRKGGVRVSALSPFQRDVVAQDLSP